MGSFNVSCGVSNLSISPGNSCGIILLIPSWNHEFAIQEWQKSPGTFLGSNEGVAHFFSPLGFPIFGAYADYGRVDEIERTPGVEALEKYFGMEIEKILELVDNSQPLYSHRTFQKIFGLPNQSKNRSLNDELLDELGFVEFENEMTFRLKGKVVDEFWIERGEQLPDPTYILRIVGENGYEIVNRHKNEVKIKRENCLGGIQFCDDWFKATKYLLGYSESLQDRWKLGRKVGGMFIRKEVYQEFSKQELSDLGPKNWMNNADVNPSCLRKFGFENYSNLTWEETEKLEDHFGVKRYSQLYRHSSSEKYVIGTDGTWSVIFHADTLEPAKDSKKYTYNVYHPNNLIQVWKKLTGHLLVAPQCLAKAKTSFVGRFKELQEKYQEIERAKNDLIQEIKFDTYFLMDAASFIPRYNYKWFVEMFRESILDDSLRQEFIDFSTFYHNLYGLNKILMPSFNGYQCGSNEMLKKLASLIVKLADKEAKERAKYR